MHAGTVPLCQHVPDITADGLRVPLPAGAQRQAAVTIQAGLQAGRGPGGSGLAAAAPMNSWPAPPRGRAAARRHIPEEHCRHGRHRPAAPRAQRSPQHPDACSLRSTARPAAGAGIFSVTMQQLQAAEREQVPPGRP